jgi:pimeloyl-ACP methyl ester carboxylesterase
MTSERIHGVKWAYTDQGKGAAVVLLHGFPLDRRVWEGQVAGLSSHYRVIAVDLPGFGESDRVSQPFTMGSLAEGVHDLLERVGALPCVLGGLSMGGYVALAYARKFPTDLTGLMLVDTRAEGDTPEGREARATMAALARREGNGPVVEQMLPKVTSPDAPGKRPEVVKRLREIMEGCPAETIALASEAMCDREDQSGALASIPVPVLVIVGERDQITPPPMAQFMQREIPKATLEVIPDAGHMAPMEQPQGVNRAMQGFLGSLFKGR